MIKLKTKIDKSMFCKAQDILIGQLGIDVNGKILLRISWDQFIDFDGERHTLEYFVALEHDIMVIPDGTILEVVNNKYKEY